MTEPGGTSTQAGIFYQNSIATLHLGRMLNLSEVGTDRINYVRSEAPEHVDDIVISYADGRKEYIQAKLNIRAKTPKWYALWRAIFTQALSEDFHKKDRILLVIGSYSDLADNIKSCCEIAASSLDESEFIQRLNKAQKILVDDIADLKGKCSFVIEVYELFRKIIVNVLHENRIDVLANEALPESSVNKMSLLSILRDVIGGKSKTRWTHDFFSISELLKKRFDITISLPTSWGYQDYKKIVLGKSEITIPGTASSKPINSVYLWPTAKKFNAQPGEGYVDETPRLFQDTLSDSVNLEAFPSSQLSSLVVVSGPGLGKSTLISALSVKLMDQSLLPVVVPIPALSKSKTGIITFLSEVLNKDYNIQIDWNSSAEAGILVLLLDGLDEISTENRIILLERLKEFVFRYPKVSWLLTARAATALPVPTNATIVEILPLSDREISRFIDLYCGNDEQLSLRWWSEICKRPEVFNLVRIPLFLAILLASNFLTNKFPRKRTELLEHYLSIIFDPSSHKICEESDLEPHILRPIMESVAFIALENEEIGFTKFNLERQIKGQTPNGTRVQAIIDGLLKCGIIKRTTINYFSFSFPIIQEYLASGYILENRSEEIENRLALAVKRPWAQTIQFVLERHADPEPLITKMLELQDDAFCSNLLLVARAAANGLKKYGSLKKNIAQKLIELWHVSSFGQREAIGDMIASAFYEPLTPELRALLSDEYFVRDSTGRILDFVGSDTLTKEILHDVLSGDHKYIMNFGSFQRHIDKLGDEAVNIYLHYLKNENPSSSNAYSIVCLIGHMDSAKISNSLGTKLVDDESLPYALRLEAILFCKNFPESKKNKMIYEGIRIGDTDIFSAAINVIRKTTNSVEVLCNIIFDKKFSVEKRLYVIEQIGHTLSNDEIETLTATINNSKINKRIKQAMLLWSAERGNKSSMEVLISQFCSIEIRFLHTALSLFGHHRDPDLCTRAVIEIEKRELSEIDRKSLIYHLHLGMTTLYKMYGFECGALMHSPMHPGRSIFTEFANKIYTSSCYDGIEHIRTLCALINLGISKYVDDLNEKVEQYILSERVEDDDSMNSLDIGQAIDLLTARDCILKDEIIDKIITSYKFNAASSAIRMLSTLGNRDAIERLIFYYPLVKDGYLKHLIKEQLELISSRLGLKILRGTNPPFTVCG